MREDARITLLGKDRHGEIDLWVFLPIVAQGIVCRDRHNIGKANISLVLGDNGIARSVLTLRLGPAGLTLLLFFEGQPGLGEGICVSPPVQSGVADLHGGGGGGGLGRQLTNVQSHLRRTNERTTPFRLSTPRSSPVSPVKGQLWPHAAMGEKSNHHGGERVMLSRRHVSPRNTSFI